MSFLFSKGKAKTPQEVVAALVEWSTGIDDIPAVEQRKAPEEIALLLLQARRIIKGDTNSDADPDQMAALAKEIYNTDLLIHLLTILNRLEFEARKDVASLFSFLLRRTAGPASPTVDYLLTRTEIFDMLLADSGEPDIYRNACSMLRDCARNEDVSRAVMEKEAFWKLFDNCRDLPFEVAADSFSTMADFVRGHSDLSRDFLSHNYERFGLNMSMFMSSDNYVIKRQALKLQSQLLKDPNLTVYRNPYITNVENLKLVMRLFRDQSKNVHTDAFNVFKIFVVNPNRPPLVVNLLAKNKLKLLAVLERLHRPGDHKEDKSFANELEFVRKCISGLVDIPNSAPPSPTHHARRPSQHARRSHSPSYIPSGPPSPSRAQIPSVLNLGQAPPVLSEQTPQLPPPEI